MITKVSLFLLSVIFCFMLGLTIVAFACEQFDEGLMAVVDQEAKSGKLTEERCANYADSLKRGLRAAKEEGDKNCVQRYEATLRLLNKTCGF